MRPSTRRREFLVLTGIGALAGCSGLPLVSDGDAATVRIGNVRLANWTEERIHISLTIRDGEGVVYEETHPVDAGEDYVVDGDWPTDRGQYTLTYGTSNTTTQVDLPGDVDQIDANCVNVDLRGMGSVPDVVFYGPDVRWGGCDRRNDEQTSPG